jgi:HK97 family phage prohead protease
MPEFKSMPAHVKAITDRTVTGLFSVFGNVDSTGDIVWPGAFAKTLQERSGQVLFLWQHSFDSPPIATITGLREIGRDELPPDVAAAYPDALGGAEVTRTYLDTPRGNEVLTAIKAGSPLQQSFGFDAVKFDFTQPDPALPPIRNLREVRLWEASDVLWGANDATRAAKAWLDFETLIQQLTLHLAERKAGARHSAADVKALNAIHAAAVELGATNCKGAADPEADAAKSRADLVSLTQLKQKLDIFTLSL